MPTPNSSIPSSAATNKQNCMSAEALLEEQQKSIDYLRKKVELLEGRISELESQIGITQTVISLLQTKIDNQEQYSRRPCLVINGLEEPGDEDEIQKIAATIEEETGISRNTVIKNLDKIHPIGQVDDAGKQKRIVKFTSGSFRETVYKNQKEKQKKLTAEQKRKKTNSCRN